MPRIAGHRHQAMGPRHRLSARPAGYADFMQLSKIWGAANGKVETSRRRRDVGASYTKPAVASDTFRVKRESLNSLYRTEKRAFGVWLLFS